LSAPSPFPLEAKLTNSHFPGPGSPSPHTSLYPWTWLQRNSYDPPSAQKGASSEYADFLSVFLAFAQDRSCTVEKYCGAARYNNHRPAYHMKRSCRAMKLGFTSG